MSKKMRRVITIVLSLIMLCSLSITALADTHDGTTTISITTGSGGSGGGDDPVTLGWNLTIPADFKIDYEAGATEISADVDVPKITVYPSTEALGSKEIRVYLKHTGFFVSGNDKLAYTLKAGNGSGNTISSSSYGSGEKVDFCDNYGQFYENGGWLELTISASEWAKAKNNATYTTTFTWSSSLN